MSLWPAAASCTAKLLPDVASSAVTGTDRTFLALFWTKFTLTEAWSSPPPLAGLSSTIVTGTVEDSEPEPPLSAPPLESAELELWATGLTAVTRPVCVLPFGISTVTFSPIVASDCRLASRSTVTTSLVEEVPSTATALPPPPVLPALLVLPVFFGLPVSDVWLPEPPLLGLVPAPLGLLLLLLLGDFPEESGDVDACCWAWSWRCCSRTSWISSCSVCLLRLSVPPLLVAVLDFGVVLAFGVVEVVLVVVVIIPVLVGGGVVVPPEAVSVPVVDVSVAVVLVSVGESLEKSTNSALDPEPG